MSAEIYWINQNYGRIASWGDGEGCEYNRRGRYKGGWACGHAEPPAVSVKQADGTMRWSRDGWRECTRAEAIAFFDGTRIPPEYRE